MSLPFRVSWIYLLLLGTCICYPSPRGHNHGYPLSDVEFDSTGGVLAPYTSGQVHAEEYLNTGNDSFDPSDQTQSMWPEGFVSLQKESVPQDQEMEEFTSNGESTVPQGRSFLAPSHPLGALIEDHKQNDYEKGVSFPTMEHFKLFVESMKDNFLMPGSNVNMYFDTDMGTMAESEPVSENPQTLTDMPSPGEDKPAQHEVGAPQDWNEPMDTVSREYEWSTINHMPSESLSVDDPAISTQNFISSYGDDSQDSGPALVSYPNPDLVVEEHLLSDHTGLSKGGFSGENLDDVTGSFDVQSNAIQSTISVQKPVKSSLSPGQDDLFSGHMNTLWVNSLASPSEGLGHHADETSISFVSGQNIEQPKYESYISDGNYFGGYEVDHIPSSSTAFTGQHPHSFSESQEKQVQSQQDHQDSIIKDPMDIGYQPAVHTSDSSSFYSSSDQLWPQNSDGYVKFQSVSPTNPTKGSEQRLTFLTIPKLSIKQDHVMLAPKLSSHKGRLFKELPGRVDHQNEVSNTKQPVKSHTNFVFSKKPPSNYQSHRIDMLPPPLPSYIVQSRNGYKRGDVSFSRTRYTPS